MFALHDLAVLVAVAESGSVRRAASLLGRTQPAVSQAIQRLEEAVGFPLLDRSAYRARLSERGETFLGRARALVTQARELETLAAVLACGVEPRLRICAHGALPLSAWMPLTEALEQEFPHTVLELQTGEGDAPMRRLLSDEAALAVVFAPSPRRHASTLELQPLGELEFVTVAHARLLASNLHDDLAALPQVLVADFEDALTGFGIVPGHPRTRVGDFHMKAALIVAGRGWGSVPTALVESELRDGTLRTISYRGMAARSRHPYFLCRKLERPHGPAARFVWERAAARAPRER